MTPRCSIVIPVHGKAGVTKRCLDRLLSSPPRVTHELVVVDDASGGNMGELLSAYCERVRVVRRAEQGGFAVACNDGATNATGELLVFLNNDTEPHDGWLDALVSQADRHPGAAAVGARLLFPDGTVQHAGVVLCCDGNPRHLYAGFPGDHPAVLRPRTPQAVTAACMLVRRTAFAAVGGFDAGYWNGLEDVDLCLRLRERGLDVHYCPDAVLTHLESATRGRRTAEIERNARRFRGRWSGRARADELETYVEDGLLDLAYEDVYPHRLRVSPLLLAVDDRDADRVLTWRARQVVDLVREVVRLTARVAELELAGSHGPAAAPVAHPAADIMERAERLERELLALQETVAERTAGATTLADPFEPAPYLTYRRLVERIRAIVCAEVPADGTIAVASKGDDRLLALDGRCAWHFPSDGHGTYAGHHPADSESAIAELERVRSAGAGYLLIPGPTLWWLDHYADFAGHLAARYRLVREHEGTCRLYALEAER